MNIMNEIAIVNPRKFPSTRAGQGGYFEGLTIETTFMTFMLDKRFGR